MRNLILFCAAFLLTLPAHAQDRPLYNSKNAPGTTIYNKGSAGRPLSLNQITQGRSNTGYSYNRQGTGFQPYGSQGASASSGLYPTMAEVESFRSQRAAEAQAMEKRALANLQQGHQGPLGPQAPVPGAYGTAQPAAGAATGTQATQAGTNAPAVKTIQRYQGRDTGVTKPPKVFNSVR